MQKNNSLESVRGFASVYVALSHWVLSYPKVSTPFKLFFSFGQEAVIVFFILSGYVIKLSWEKGLDNSFRTYFIKRFRRIYFPFIISIILAIIVNRFPINYKEMLGNFLMLQDFATGKPGNIVNTFMGNSPLWSLSYEWWFYLIFPFLYPPIKNKKSRIYFVGVGSIVSLLLYIIFPNHMFLIPLYLFIWWIGLELVESKNNEELVNKRLFKGMMIILSLIIAILVLISVIEYQNKGSLRMGVYPLLFIRHFFFALIIVIVLRVLPCIKRLVSKCLDPFKAVSPISYSLYIFHYVIFVQLQTPLPILLEVPMKVGIVLILCYVTEIKLQPIINRIVR